MGDKDERIETLKARRAAIESGLGGVELEVRDVRNEPRAGKSDRDLNQQDQQIAALTSERESLQQEFGRSSGELDELERGTDGQLAPEARDRTEGDTERTAPREARTESAPPEIAQPETAGLPAADRNAPGSDTAEVTPEQSRSAGQNAPGSTQLPGQGAEPERPGHDWLLRSARPEQGFGPFEAARPGDVPWESSSSPRPFFRTVADAERMRSEEQLHETQLNELHALRTQLDQHWAPAEQAINELAATRDSTTEKLAVHREGYRNEFEYAAHQVNELWTTHRAETQASNANTLVRADNQLLPQSDQREDRAMAMASEYCSTAQSMCNSQAITQVRIAHVEYLSAYAEIESDQAKVQAYRQSLQESFANDVEQRIEPLMTQHFPGISQEGRSVALGTDPPSMAQPAGPDGQGPSGPSGTGPPGMAQLPGPGGPGRGGP